jgi:hypothetical protein
MTLWLRTNLFFISGLVITTTLALSFSEAAPRKIEALENLSREAYIWGYPAVLMKHTREAMFEKIPSAKNPTNQVFHSASAPEIFLKNLMTVNSENLYSWAWLDLTEEPLLFSQAADSKDYFSIQCVDAFTNVFQVISNETLAGKGATFAMTSPTWKGELPPGVVRLKATTPEVFVLAQTSASKRTQELQLIPLSSWKKGLRKMASAAFVPKETVHVETNLALLGTGFLTELFEVTKKNTPPTGADLKQLQLFSQKFSAKPTTEEKTAIERGLFAGARKIEDRKAVGFGAKVNGWSYEIKAEPFREDYLLRAAVAQINLFSAPSKEYIHLKATADSEDRQLYGNFKYEMHFKKGELPPTPTSWTLRVFEASPEKEGAPTETAHLNDRATALKYNEDGSMDIHLQQEPPEEKPRKANWLVLDKEANFFVLLTIYNPNNSVINRKFVAPAITRLEEDELKRPKIVRTMMAETRVSKRDPLCSRP